MMKDYTGHGIVVVMRIGGVRGAPILAALALLGCGDNLAPSNELRSGERLKLIRYLYDGDAQEVERDGLWDSELAARCTIERYSDGATYCTPAADEAVYADSRCASLRGRVMRAVDAPQFFRTYYSLGSDVAPSRLYRAGKPALTPPGIWRVRDRECVGPEDANDSSYAYFEIGDEVPLDDLRIKYTQPSANTRLEAMFATAADGLRAPASFYDHELELECRMATRANAASTSCVPRGNRAYISYFADAACESPIVPVESAFPLAERYRYSDGCVDYYRVGSEVDVPTVYQQQGTQCVAVTLVPPGRFNATSRLELASVPREPRGAGRLQSIGLGELPIDDVLLHDTMLAADCRHALFSATGELRCVPDQPLETKSLFTDSTCATVIDVAFMPVNACAPMAIYTLKADAFRQILEPYTGPLYEYTTGDRCGVYPSTSAFVAHSVGPVLPASTFAAAALVIDP